MYRASISLSAGLLERGIGVPIVVHDDLARLVEDAVVRDVLQSCVIDRYEGETFLRKGKAMAGSGRIKEKG